MTTVVGGLRTRFIHDSVEAALMDILTQLHWLDAGRRHRPITVVAAPQKWDEPIEFNSITVDMEGMGDEEAEMGSNLTNDTHTVYLDFYGENEAIARHLTGDLAAALRGKLPSIGRASMTLPIFDFRTNPATVLTVAAVENVVTDRAHNFPNPWQQHWHSVRFDLIDTYGDEYDDGIPAPPPLLPGPNTLPGPTLLPSP